MRFKDRWDAGRKLATASSTKITKDTVVLALPRGGIPLGICIADQVNAPLDLIFSKKIAHPSHPEFAIGAIAEDGEPIFNETLINAPNWLADEIAKIQQQTKKRRELYQHILIKQTLRNKEVLLVDDGIATGMTMLAAIHAVKSRTLLKFLWLFQLFRKTLIMLYPSLSMRLLHLMSLTDF